MCNLHLEVKRIYRSKVNLPALMSPERAVIKEGDVVAVDSDGNWFSLRVDKDGFRVNPTYDAENIKVFRDYWQVIVMGRFASGMLTQTFEQAEKGGLKLISQATK